MLKYDSFESLQIHLSLLFFFCLHFFLSFILLWVCCCLPRKWCFYVFYLCDVFLAVCWDFHRVPLVFWKYEVNFPLLRRRKREKKTNQKCTQREREKREEINYIFITSTPAHWDFRMGAAFTLRLQRHQINNFDVMNPTNLWQSF